MTTPGKITFNSDEKFDVQLRGGMEAENRLANLLECGECTTFEVKSESWQWEQTGNIAIEYMSGDRKSGISVTKADYWAHELTRDGSTLMWLVVPMERMKELARAAIKAGHRASGGDNGQTKVALLKLTDLLR